MPSKVDLASAANRAGAASRVPGAPRLTADASVEQLVRWFAWNDPNGAWTPCSHDDDEGDDCRQWRGSVECQCPARCDECIACRPITVEEAWEVLAEMVADDIEEG